MDELQNKQANDILNVVISFLDEKRLEYSIDNEKRIIRFSYPGDDMMHRMIIHVASDSCIIRFRSYLNFTINPDACPEIGKAVCLINDKLLYGGFEFNYDDDLYYDYSMRYDNCIIDPSLIGLLLSFSLDAIEDYDDKLMAINKGYMKADNVLDA